MMSQSNPEAQSPASGLLWIALNKVCTWTLIQVVTIYCQIHSDWTFSNESSCCLKPVDFCTFVQIWVLWVVMFLLYSSHQCLKWRCLKSRCAQPSSSSWLSHVISICSFAIRLKNRWERFDGHHAATCVLRDPAPQERQQQPANIKCLFQRHLVPLFWGFFLGGGVCT